MPAPADHPEDVKRALDARRVCVTGGAGFVGCHLVAALLDVGAEVCVIDDLSGAAPDRLDELFKRARDRLDFVHGSILDPEALFDATDGAEVVFHLAAISSVQASIENPRRSMDVNAAGSVRVAEAARETRARRLVYAASSSAYGDGPTPHRENAPPRPMSPYAAGKLAGEHIASAWAASMGLDAVSLRFFNIFGAGQPSGSPYSGVIPSFIARLTAGERPVIYGDGEQTRDFVPVADAVRALLLAAAVREPLRGEVVNVGSGAAVSVLELARTLARLVGREDLEPRFEPARAGDIRESLADCTKAYAVLGYTPGADLETALAELVGPAQGARAASDA